MGVVESLLGCSLNCFIFFTVKKQRHFKETHSIKGLQFGKLFNSEKISTWQSSQTENLSLESEFL